MDKKKLKTNRTNDHEDNFCYVLISCDEPSETGEMSVKMTYKGDILLASYLVQGAQEIIEEELEASLQIDS